MEYGDGSYMNSSGQVHEADGIQCHAAQGVPESVTVCKTCSVFN